jgi:hypothetical protein
MASYEQDPTEPDGIKDNTPRGNSEVMRAKDRKANAAIQLRIAGASWDEVAEVVGYPSGHAALVATERALEKELRTEENQKAMRSLAGKRLERMLRGVWTKAIDPNNPEHLAAVDRARLLIDRHAKLYGLDAPTEYVVTSPSQSELENWVGRVLSVQTNDLKEPDIFDITSIEDDDEDGGGSVAIPAG